MQAARAEWLARPTARAAKPTHVFQFDDTIIVLDRFVSSLESCQSLWAQIGIEFSHNNLTGVGLWVSRYEDRCRAVDGAEFCRGQSRSIYTYN